MIFQKEVKKTTIKTLHDLKKQTAKTNNVF